MKRAAAPKRKTPLKAKTALARTPPPKRKTPLHASPKATLRDEKWHQGVASKPCAKCGRKRVRGKPTKGHHILYRQWLHTVAKARGLYEEHYDGDTRNRLALCDDCHEAHHRPGVNPKRIPLAVIRKHAPKVFQFARELGLEWRLGPPTYPDE